MPSDQISTGSIRLTRAGLVTSGLATLALALAACVGPGLTPSAAPTPSAGPTLSAGARATASAGRSAAPSPSATASSGAPADPEPIHLILRPINDVVGSLTECSSTGSCQGDFMVGYDPLFDATTGKEVGTFAYECFLVDPETILYHCPGATITLVDRGQIVFTEVIEHAPGKPAGNRADHGGHR